MGEMIEFKCPQCNYNLELFEGIGMLFDYEKFIHPTKHPNSMWSKVIKSKDILRKIDDLFLNYNGKFIYKKEVYNEESDEYSDDYLPYGYKLYYSKKRKMVYSLFDFEIEYIENGKKKIYKPEYEKNINYDLIPLEYELLPDVKCPKCGGSMNELMLFVNWD